MEDYLEMICRSAQQEGYACINHLALALGVRPSSASKMVGSLKELAMWIPKKYGIVKPTERGWKLGRYLLTAMRFSTPSVPTQPPRGRNRTGGADGTFLSGVHHLQPGKTSLLSSKRDFPQSKPSGR